MPESGKFEGPLPSSIPAQPQGRRLTIDLTPVAAQEVETLCAYTCLSTADLFREAMSLLRKVVMAEQQGNATIIVNDSVLRDDRNKIHVIEELWIHGPEHSTPLPASPTDPTIGPLPETLPVAKELPVVAEKTDEIIPPNFHPALPPHIWDIVENMNVVGMHGKFGMVIDTEGEEVKVHMNDDDFGIFRRCPDAQCFADNFKLLYRPSSLLLTPIFTIRQDSGMLQALRETLVRQEWLQESEFWINVNHIKKTLQHKV